MARFLIANAACGVAIGILIAGGLLATDTLDLLSLVKSGPDPIATAIALVAGCVATVTPMVIATSLAIGNGDGDG